MSAEKKSYFNELAKKGYLLIALLITTLAMTAFVASYDYGIFGTIMKHPKVLALVLVIAAVFAVMMVLYLLISLKVKKITVADAFYFAALFVGVFFLLYVLIALKSFNFRRAIVPIVLIILGAALIALRIKGFNKAVNESKAKSNNVIKAYFSEIFDKFSFFGIIIAAGVAVCLVYLVLNPSVVVELFHTKNFILIGVICLLPLVAFAVKGAISKTVTLFDAVLVMAALVLPISLVHILLTAFSTAKIILWAVILAVYLVCLMFRFTKYEVDACSVKPACACKCYFKSVANKFDLVTAIAIGALIALTASVLLASGTFIDSLFEGGVSLKNIHISTKGLPVIVVTLSAIVGIGLFALIALLGVKKKSVGISDYALMVSASFNVFGLITLIAYPSIVFLYGLLIFTAYTLILLIIRLTTIKKA